MSVSSAKKTILRAQDLSCPSCVAKIEKALGTLDGVNSANVHFATGRIAVEHDPRKAPVDRLIETVAKVGYTAKASPF